LDIALLDYEAGSAFEPLGTSRPSTGVAIACPNAYLYDHHLGAWQILGDPDALPVLCATHDHAHTLGTLCSAQGPTRYRQHVAEAIDLIRAGDIFQVNLAHRLVARFEGSSRGLFMRLLARARPAYGALLELPDRTVLSMSPKLFLAFDPVSRTCTARPMKGTDTDLDALQRSTKDAAKLRMIVDLMRNDLSRVCEIGSVRVDDARTIEPHADGQILQGVATVTGVLRAEMTIADLLRAACPAGSITGAPKVRAMQIIDQLEADARGAYCGSIGLIDASGRAVLSVAIRTATITGEPCDAPGQYHAGRLEYPVGAGIVADSTPDLEWEETLAKASLWEGITRVKP